MAFRSQAGAWRPRAAWKSAKVRQDIQSLAIQAGTPLVALTAAEIAVDALPASPESVAAYLAIALPVVVTDQPVPTLPAADIETAVRFARNEKAPATRAAYRSDFAAFRVWCLAKGGH